MEDSVAVDEKIAPEKSSAVGEIVAGTDPSLDTTSKVDAVVYKGVEMDVGINHIPALHIGASNFNDSASPPLVQGDENDHPLDEGELGAPDLEKERVDRSCFIFPATDPIRSRTLKVVKSKYFDMVILVFIILNCIC